MASSSDLVGCAGAEGAVRSLAFDFVSSFGFVFVPKTADDDDGFAREGSERRLSAFGGARGSPVAALNVERSDWKLMVTGGPIYDMEQGKPMQYPNNNSTN